MVFSQKMRKSMEGQDLIKVAKAMGVKWGKLSDKQKAVYNEPAKKEFAAWKLKFEKYKKTSKWRKFDALRKAVAEKKYRKSRAPPKDANKPKRNMSAFFIYQIATRKKGVSLKAVASKWKKLGSGAKKKYEDKAAADKKRYDSAMKKYKGSAKQKAHQKAVKKHWAKVGPTKKQAEKNKLKAKNEKKREAQKARTAKKKAHAKKMAANKRARLAKSRANKNKKKEEKKARRKALAEKQRASRAKKKEADKAKRARAATRKKAAAAKKKATAAKKKATAAAAKKKKAAAAKKKVTAKKKKAKKSTKRKAKRRTKAKRKTKAKRTARK